MTTFQLVYLSSATPLMSRDDLVDILQKSRKNNTSLGITGMLLYKDGNIMQVLEGEEASVRTLYQKIAQDKRHSGAIILLQENIPEREFSQWSMAFRDLGSAEIRATPGFSEFMNTSLSPQEFNSDKKKGQRLLKLFRENNR